VARDRMEIKFRDQAVDDLDKMDNSTYLFFMKHFEKIAQIPPRRHLKFGIPVHVEDVGQGRIIYQIENETLFIIRCFADHKEYEKWYRSVK
jgi:mRNA-degrading endonuclease RelE of RelBE toxin-antitoxin system